VCGQIQMLTANARLVALFLVAALLLALGCTKEGEAINAGGDTATTAKGSEVATQTFHHIADESSRDLDAEKAIAGDPEAAERFIVGLQETDERDEWIRMGAENGSPGLMALYAQLLQEKGGARRCKRALFWLGRATEVNPSMSEHNEILRREIEEDARCDLPVDARTN